MSSAELRSDGSLSLKLSLSARLLGCWLRREIKIRADEIVEISQSDSAAVGHQLRWKIAGAAITRQRAIGWFSWVGNRGRWAWVWITPNREMVVIKTSRKLPALIAVPADWF